jgi:hypothetical protein
MTYTLIKITSTIINYLMMKIKMLNNKRLQYYLTMKPLKKMNLYLIKIFRLTKMILHIIAI